MPAEVCALPPDPFEKENKHHWRQDREVRVFDPTKPQGLERLVARCDGPNIARYVAIRGARTGMEVAIWDWYGVSEVEKGRVEGRGARARVPRTHRPRSA